MWRRRSAEDRLDRLHDEPRPGKPRTVTDDDVERVIVKTLEETPTHATHWSSYSMAKATSMSQSTVSRIWRPFGLKPHLVEEFKLSPDPQLIDKARDIVALYLNPPDAAVVLCVNERTQVHALDRTAPVLPLMPGVPERRTHDYKRHGTTNLYAALNVASGRSSTRSPPGTEPPSSSDCCASSMRQCPPISKSTSCWTTCPPTRRRRCSAGS